MAPAYDPAGSRPRIPWGGVLALVAAALLLVAALIARGIVRRAMPHLPPANSSHLVVTPSPDVVLAVRSLARLETADFHMERVVELTDEQSHLFGVVQARDSLLLIAVGEVIAGVDLEHLAPGDVTADFAHRAVRIRLPAPEVFSSSLDNAQTHVYRRTTDSLAQRREDLEGRARNEAETTMRRGAVTNHILERARDGAEREVRSLLRAMGFGQIVIEWTEPRGGDTPG